MTQLKGSDFLGFTLIEIVVIVVIVGALGTIALSSLKPIEQINRGRDSSSLLIASEFLQTTHRFQAINQPPPWEENLSAVPLGSELGIEIINKYISADEIKGSFLNQPSNQLEKIFLSTNEGYEEIYVCFLPESDAFRSHKLTKYNQTGQITEECNRQDCYLCLSNTSTDQLAQASESTPVQVNTDEYPPYPWTCVNSDRYLEYGCNSFCTHDLGCTSACNNGERQLMKSYGVSGSGGRYVDCINQHSQTVEYYCVTDPDARCDLTNGGRSWVDHFYWNLTLSAPTRWREPHEPVAVWKPWGL